MFIIVIHKGSNNLIIGFTYLSFNFAVAIQLFEDMIIDRDK